MERDIVGLNLAPDRHIDNTLRRVQSSSDLVAEPQKGKGAQVRRTHEAIVATAPRSNSKTQALTWGSLPSLPAPSPQRRRLPS